MQAFAARHMIADELCKTFRFDNLFWIGYIAC